LNNLTVLGLLIIIMWLAALAYNFYVSGQQDDLAEDIDRLEKLLDNSEKEG
jgi:Tfp pilus assembly protein PilO